jgi:hypothetical protein
MIDNDLQLANWPNYSPLQGIRSTAWDLTISSPAGVPATSAKKAVQHITAPTRSNFARCIGLHAGVAADCPALL